MNVYCFRVWDILLTEGKNRSEASVVSPVSFPKVSHLFTT